MFGFTEMDQVPPPRPPPPPYSVVDIEGSHQRPIRFSVEYCGIGDNQHGTLRPHDFVCLQCSLCISCGYQINPTKTICARENVHQLACWNETCQHKLCTRCQFYCCDKTDCSCFRCLKKECEGNCQCYNCENHYCYGNCACKHCGIKLIPGQICPCQYDKWDI